MKRFFLLSNTYQQICKNNRCFYENMILQKKKNTDIKLIDQF